MRTEHFYGMKLKEEEPTVFRGLEIWNIGGVIFGNQRKSDAAKYTHGESMARGKLGIILGAIYRCMDYHNGVARCSSLTTKLIEEITKFVILK